MRVLSTLSKYLVVFPFVIIAMTSACDESSGKSTQDVLHNVQSCPNKTIQLQIDGHSLVINKRQGLTVWKNDKTQITRLDHACDQEAFNDASVIEWPDFKVSSDERMATVIVPSQNKKFISTLSDGTSKFESKQYEFFVLPTDASKTLDGSAVTIRCPNLKFKVKSGNLSKCETSYKHVSGLTIYYSFLRKHHDENSFVSVDETFRKRLEEMLKN